METQPLSPQQPSSSIEKKTGIIIAGVALVFLVAAAFLHGLSKKESPGATDIAELSQTYFSVDGVSLNAWVANTEASREEGLSDTAPLKNGQGMLFVFDEPGYYSFWMKEMNYPLDMIWFDANKKVVFIEENAIPASFPEQFSPTTPAQYVLEVPSGFAHAHNVKAGDQASFSL